MVPVDKMPIFHPDEPLTEALERLGASDLNRGLVLEDGRLVGLLSITDVARALEIGGPAGRRQQQRR
jgi:CBS domain-containing protein